jgi:hydrogenase-4 component E
MTTWIEGTLLLLILTDLVLLGSSRIAFCVRVVVLQGIVLGLLPLLTHTVSEWTLRLVLLSSVAVLVKGVIFPRLLLKALRDAQIRHEIDPLVNTTLSLLLGVLGLMLVLVLAYRLELPGPTPSRLAAPAAFFTTAVGLFLISARKNALTQVLGYLVMENGIFAFGTLLTIEQPWLVEMGVLLDVFVAVFVMGIIIFHIRQEFDHVDTDRLTHLHDWKPWVKNIVLEKTMTSKKDWEA